MSDRGQGIRLFSTEGELQSIFDEWESARPDSDDEDEDEDEDGDSHDLSSSAAKSTDYITTSHLRHFLAQSYIHPPLLLPSVSPAKFHIRTYVLAVGSLKVYVYRSMLALFAAAPYVPPWETGSEDVAGLGAHLTNTCLQNSTREGDDESVREFWSLPESVNIENEAANQSKAPAGNWKEDVFRQICAIAGEIFEAAARGMMVHFQTLPNAFEVFGVDFLVDAQGTVWLLEINAFPDFGQTGGELKGVVEGVWEGVMDVAVRPFFGLGEGEMDDRNEGSRGSGMVLVKEVDLGRR